MLKAGEVFDIAMLAHGTPPEAEKRRIAAAPHYHAPPTLQTLFANGMAVSGGPSFRKPRQRLSGIHTIVVMDSRIYDCTS
jgi:hypothetical protein